MNGFFFRMNHLLFVLIRWTLDKRIPFKIRIIFLLSCTLIPVKRSVRFLGHDFTSDNTLSLLTLPEYAPLVLDVHQKIARTSELQILDIGSNVGQFAFSWLKLVGGKCLSVEPNSTIYPYLRLNMNSLDQSNTFWKVIEAGCGPDTEMKTLWFVPKKSAQGSLNQDFAGQNLMGSTKMRSLEFLFQPISEALVQSLGFSSTKFDLVKIDVEGNEVSAIKGLEDIHFDYALIEIMEKRGSGSTLKDVQVALELCTRKTISVIHVDNPLNDESICNVLFKIG